MTNVTILGVFRTHAQKEYGKVLEIKSIYIFNILAIFFFLNSQWIYSKSGLNGTQYKGVKWGVGVESARLYGIVNGESLWNVFCCLLCIFFCQTTPIFKTLGQFENLVFVIMSTRENIRLIARTSFNRTVCPESDTKILRACNSLNPDQTRPNGLTGDAPKIFLILNCTWQRWQKYENLPSIQRVWKGFKMNTALVLTLRTPILTNCTLSYISGSNRPWYCIWIINSRQFTWNIVSDLISKTAMNFKNVVCGQANIIK